MKTQRTTSLGVIVGYALMMAGLAIAPVFAQAQDLGKIPVASAGTWCVCIDVTAASMTDAQAMTFSVQLDGAPPQAWTGATFATTAATDTFRAKLPIGTLPASGRALGTHTVAITATGGSVVLGDGSVLPLSPSPTLLVAYSVIPGNTPTPKNPKLEKN
jgi:hypothetical protein